MRPSRSAWWSLALVVLAGCARCGLQAPPARELTYYLPKTAEAALVVPDLRIVGDRLGTLEKLKVASFLAGTQGFGTADELVSSLMSQLGIDLRSSEALIKAGVDPARGLGVAALTGNDAYLVVGMKDEATLRSTLATLARTRLGASQLNTRIEHGVSLSWYSHALGTPPQLGVVTREGVAFITSGPSVDRLPALASVSPEASLAQDAAFAASLQRLPGPRDFIVYAPSTSSLVRAYNLPGLALVGALTPAALTVRMDMPWPNTRSSLAVLDKKVGPDVSSLLPPQAFLVARFQGDPSLLAPFWPYLVGHVVEQAVANSGFDIKSEVLDNLQPGAMAAIALAPTAKLGGAMPELDVRRTNPFQFVQLVAIAKAKDAAKAQLTLDKLAPVAQRFGAHVEAAQRGGKKVYLTTYAQGEGTDFALSGDTLILAAPAAQLDAALARASAPAAAAGPLTDPALRAALGERGVSLVVDLHQLAESVKALPSQAWGIGGFAIKATTIRWLDATDDLRAVTAGLSQKDGAVQGELSLRFAPK